jgi:hypothetical protein
VALVALLAFPDIEIGNPKTPKISTDTPHCLFSGPLRSESVGPGWDDPVLADFAASGIFLDEIILSTSDKSAQGFECPDGVMAVCTDLFSLGRRHAGAVYLPSLCLMIFDLEYCPPDIPELKYWELTPEHLRDLPSRSPKDWLEFFKEQAEQSKSPRECRNACVGVHESRHAVDAANNPLIKRCETEINAFEDQLACLKRCTEKHCNPWGIFNRECRAIWNEYRTVEAGIRVNKCICERTSPRDPNGPEEPSGPKDPICEACYNECKDGGFESVLCQILVDGYCRPIQRADLSCDKDEDEPIDPAIGF